MPAGTDLVTWSPRVGASGDDRYNLPAEARFEAGSSSFSTTPTLAEVNASSGMNQVIAECRRRRSFTPSFKQAGDPVKAAHFTDLQAHIDAIRSIEEMSAWSWSAVPAAGGRIQAAHLSELRKALAVDNVYVRPYFDYGTTYYPGLYKTKASYPPDGSASIWDFSSDRAGQYLSGGFYYDHRGFVQFVLPAGAPTPGSVKIGMNIETIYGTGWKLRIYHVAEALFSLDSADWSRLDTLIYEDTPSTGLIEVATSMSGVSPGDTGTLVMGGDTEITDAGAANQWCSRAVSSDRGILRYLRFYTA
jgi:hypothetical protein